MRLTSLATLILTLVLAPAAFAGTMLSGTVLDGDGRAVAGAQVILVDSSAAYQETTSDRSGKFRFEAPGEGASVTVVSEGFATATEPVTPNAAEVRVVLTPSAISEEITVSAPAIPTRSSAGTKTDTPLRDVPQAATVITKEVMTQQSMRSIADVVRYVPGVGIAQGEGHRDAPVFRGNTSTSDFFVDGIRDDAQYYRDIYNLERVEALKGPNAMIFGRGGVGGVLNRVTRQANWAPEHELTLQGGSWDDARVTGDFGQAFSAGTSARVTTLYERSDSFRTGSEMERYGVNPTMAFMLGSRTLLRAGFEHFQDTRTVDRGVSSWHGRPVDVNPSTFFGNSSASNSDATVNSAFVSLDHAFSSGARIISRLGFADYDKFYENVYPGAVNAAGTSVSISAYNNGMQRQNLFSQTDLSFTRSTGRVTHTILSGIELGRQDTANQRLTGYFTSVGSNVTSVNVPLSQPQTSLPVQYRQSASDADNQGVADVAAIYVQDQIGFTKKLQVIAGIRYDHFDVEMTNNRNGATYTSTDGLVSPRLGLVYKPVEAASIYASYSMSYLPRAGEQLSSLSVSNQSLDPEEFRNYEVGAKWQWANAMEFNVAVYRLDRGNVVAPDPVNPAVSVLVDGQRSEGVELSVNGNINPRWSMVGSYAWQDGEILESLSATATAGARLAQLPEHTASLWNRYELTPSFGLGIGVIHRSEMFTSTDNTVVVPSFTRADAAVFYTVTRNLRAQLNIENLFDTEYFASAHSNTNIMPGTPRSVRLSWSTRF